MSLQSFLQNPFGINNTRSQSIGPEAKVNNGVVTSVPQTNNYSYQTSSPAFTGPAYQGPMTTKTNTGNNGQAPVQQINNNAPMEPTPEGTEINWDEIYAPAFDALNQAEQAQQSSYQQGMGEAQSGYEGRSADLQSEQAARMANFGQQRAGETKRTEGAVAEARRMASQLLQGLQSQYGGSTGTGAFRGEQIGAAATQNIAGNREALQTALTGIANSENALKDKVLGLQNEEDRNLQQSKLGLKAELDKALTSISQSRGQLSVDKGARRQEALSQYRQQVMDVEARNTQFKQTLYTQAQAQAQKLAGFKQSAQDKYSANLKMANLTNGQQISVGNKQFQVTPDSQGDIKYLEGNTVAVEGDSNGDGIPDYLE